MYFFRARAAYVNTPTVDMMKNGNMNQLFFIAKNKNEDSDLGWTADLKINLDKLYRSCQRGFFDGSQCYGVTELYTSEKSGDSAGT